MSRFWARMLVLVVVVEILGIGGIAAWAKFIKPHPSSPTTVHTATKQLKPPKIEAVAYVSGLNAPTSLAATGDKTDSRLFFTEKPGLIRIINPSGKLADQPFLDIKKLVNNEYGQAEMGLLGLAFHPNFAQSGYFYVDYNDHDRNTIIARYQVDKKTGLADPTSQKILLTIAQPFANHKGGQLAFGPDGYLYIGMGDGGGTTGDPGNRGQDRSQLLGKILRIDVDHGEPYAIPAGNPFINQKGVKPEIWAYGLRNPWRFSFDAKTGDLYIGDVGQNSYEEVDYQKAKDKGGENYGWRCYEGSRSFNTAGCQDASQYVMPILDYDHSQKRCSIIGGYVYRGTAQPALVGKYFYGDFCGGQIYYTEQQNDDWEITTALSTTFGISTFGQANNGELYVVDINGGAIYHLVDTANK